MTVQLVAVVVDALAPGALAGFWATALRGNIQTTDGPDVQLVPTDPTTFRLLFRPTAHDKRGQNRIHFDLTTTSPGDQNTTVDELLALGAQRIDIGQHPEESHVVLADPEGNELCIIEPENHFVAGCPRLGAVNCDGTRALGLFYSQALGWPLVWDQDEETAIQAPDGNGPKITWSGPPLMPRHDRERIHLHLAPSPHTSLAASRDQLLALGASIADDGAGCPGAVGLTDVDANPLCLVERELVDL